MDMHRRDFITLLVTSVWPAAARAQKSDRMRRIGVLMPFTAEDPHGQDRDSVFRQALQERGWSEGHNVRIDFRWSARDLELFQKYAVELVALSPDVILAGSGLVVAPLRQATPTIPIVFTATIDPVGRGFVQSLARPGGNTTGFINIEYSFSAKWLELLKQIAPGVTRAAVLRDPAFIGSAQFAAIEALAPSLQVDVSPIDMYDAGQIERAITLFAAKPNGGLILTASITSTLHSSLIIDLAARHRIPAVYPNRFHVIAGGLISYGPIFLDQYRNAAGYVDRILLGAKPADLPVQAPVRYETVLNHKTAENLNLKIPLIVNARVDEFVE